MTPTFKLVRSVLGSAAILALGACTGDDIEQDEQSIGSTEAALALPWEPSEFKPFSFESKVSESGEFADGDVRLDAVQYGRVQLPRWALQTVKRVKILVDDGVDVVRGGHNLASGQGINSELDDWASEGPATITPTGEDLAASLDNYNLTSIIVTREAEGTASVEVSFAVPVNTLFFWERGSASSPTTANSDILVEALDWKGEVSASYKLLRSQYQPTGIEITSWNGSFASPSTPTGAYPRLGSVGLELDGAARRFRLTSVQQAVGGTRDDGPDYKVLGALLPGFVRP